MAGVGNEARPTAGQPARDAPSDPDRYLGIGLAVPELDRHRDLLEAKAPGPGEQLEVVEHAAAALAQRLAQILDQRGAHLRPREDRAVGRGLERSEQLQRPGRKALHQAGRERRERARRPGRPAQQRERAAPRRRERGGDRRIVERPDPAHDAGDPDALRHAVGAGGDVRAAAGDAGQREALDAEAVGERRDVVRPLRDRPPGLEVG